MSSLGIKVKRGKLRLSTQWERRKGRQDTWRRSTHKRQCLWEPSIAACIFHQRLIGFSIIFSRIGRFEGPKPLPLLLQLARYYSTWFVPLTCCFWGKSHLKGRGNKEKIPRRIIIAIPLPRELGKSFVCHLVPVMSRRDSGRRFHQRR